MRNLRNEEIIKQIKKKIRESFGHHLTIKNIILFGSRAKRKETKYSDWDILVVVKENMSLLEKRKFAKKIREKLAEDYISCDLIIRSEQEIGYYKDFIGTVTREAIREGIII
jgi:predicted nucleotidyltransferase